MKFRNKKTGDIKDWNFSNWYQAMLNPKNKEKYECNLSDFLDRVVKFREEWEDAEGINVPSMPLIKDEKIRKAVRAWAEACGVEEYVSVSDLSPAFTRFYTNEYEIDIKTENNLRLSEREYYTIAELCGEEEE